MEIRAMSTWDEDSFRGDVGDAMLGAIVVTGGGALRRSTYVVTKTISANSITYHSGCANSPDLKSTASIDTAASVTLLTHTAPACNKTNNNVQITVLQPSGAKMTSTHTVNLLLNKLPTDARLAHRLPGLVNNLLLVAVLCDAGCEVFFHKHGCEVTHTGETILRGWRDPKNPPLRCSEHRTPTYNSDSARPTPLARCYGATRSLSDTLSRTRFNKVRITIRRGYLDDFKGGLWRILEDMKKRRIVDNSNDVHVFN